MATDYASAQELHDEFGIGDTNDLNKVAISLTAGVDHRGAARPKTLFDGRACQVRRHSATRRRQWRAGLARSS